MFFFDNNTWWTTWTIPQLGVRERFLRFSICSCVHICVFVFSLKRKPHNGTIQRWRIFSINWVSICHWTIYTISLQKHPSSPNTNNIKILFDRFFASKRPSVFVTFFKGLFEYTCFLSLRPTHCNLLLARGMIRLIVIILFSLF